MPPYRPCSITATRGSAGRNGVKIDTSAPLGKGTHLPGVSHARLRCLPSGARPLDHVQRGLSTPQVFRTADPRGRRGGMGGPVVTFHCAGHQHVNVVGYLPSPPPQNRLARSRSANPKTERRHSPEGLRKCSLSHGKFEVTSCLVRTVNATRSRAARKVKERRRKKRRKDVRDQKVVSCSAYAQQQAKDQFGPNRYVDIREMDEGRPRIARGLQYKLTIPLRRKKPIDKRKQHLLPVHYLYTLLY